MLPLPAPGADRETVAVIGAGQPAEAGARFLVEDGWQVVRLDRLAPGEATDQLAGASVIVVDLAALPEETGTDGLAALAEACPDAALLALARPGAPPRRFHGRTSIRPRFVAAPVTRERLLRGLESAISTRNLLLENRTLRQELRAATRLEDWVGCSGASAGIRSAITTAAFSTGPVFILGEPGTGRKLAAELIHRLGRQSSMAFLPLKAGSLPAGELGAVLAALRRAVGDPGAAIRRARPGSVYLSGAERLGGPDQAVLHDAVRRAPPFRLLVSADPGVSGQVRARAFRGRLLRRLSGLTIRIPPLRERREDVPALALHFLSRACRSAGVGPYGISPTTVEAYSAHDWPGNTAELRMWIERAVATAAVSRFAGSVLPDAVCSPPDAPPAAPARLDHRPLKQILAGIERSLIQRALRRTGGNQKRAAARLQVNPTTLHEKMKRHGLLRRRPVSSGSGSASPGGHQT